MNTATRNGKPTRTATRRLLGVLGVFWLNLVVAPCALAFGAEHACGHCPPERATDMAAHHGHHDETAGAGCDALMSDCGSIGTFAHECRPAKPELKGKSEPASMAPPVAPDLTLRKAGLSMTTADPPDPPGTFRSLHLLNCVFLD